jgi:hypothetical protein
MIKTYFIFYCFLFLTLTTVAQKTAAISTSKKVDNITLNKLAYRLKAEKELQQAKINQYKNIISFPTHIGSNLWDKRSKNFYFTGISKYGMPMFKTTFDTFQLHTMGTSRVHPNYWGGPTLNLTGMGLRVAMIDEGRVMRVHEKLDGYIGSNNRFTNFEPDTLYLGDHATLVASDLGARTNITSNPLSGLVRGAAYEANVDVWDFTNDLSKIDSLARNLIGVGPYLVTNHSYGINPAWVSDGVSVYWLGDTLQTGVEDNNLGWYGDLPATLDTIAHANPNLLMFWAAGNFRWLEYVGPHKVWDKAAMAWVNSNTVRPRLGTAATTGDGFDCILSHQTAKNILTVGSVEPILNAQGYNGPSSIILNNYSACGPTDDGRIKPDVVAPGDYVRSASVNRFDLTQNDYYVTTYGTSNSSPFAAGSGLLLQEHYANENAGAYMPASTLKALLIHSAVEVGPTVGPDYRTGYGLVDTKGAADIISTNSLAAPKIIESLLMNNEVKSYSIQTGSIQPLKVTIVWNDPPGEATPEAVNFDNSAKKLVNDLDIYIQDNLGNLYYPYVLNPMNPTAAATKAVNSVDNVEQIFIENPNPASTYFLVVKHKNSLKTGASQDFSLIITGNLGTTLPLDVESFTGNVQPLYNALKWEVSRQTADVNFAIERSVNGAAFTAVANLGVATNNSNVYNYNDNNVTAGNYKYRIKITNGAGITKYSNIVNLERKSAGALFIFPNPAKEAVTIDYNSDANGKLQLAVYDNKGAMVQQINYNTVNGANRINLKLPIALASGVYTIVGKGVVNFTKEILVQQ